MAAGRAGEQQARLVFISFPLASVPVSAVFDLMLRAPGSGPASFLWQLGLGALIALGWTVVMWWPAWNWFHRNGFSVLVLVPFMTGAGALLCLPFVVLSPFIGGGLLVPLLTGLFGTAVGIAGSLVAVAAEAVRRARGRPEED
ncbi:hypothetical protein ACFQ36_13730 [Arthrobacter sp. GCM10027362]|uniref:hypothetical protein n=1 Tax=Arthrobacter sp. GCM10027362 TaxID=3273379 RepID=UPI00362BB232